MVEDDEADNDEVVKKAEIEPMPALPVTKTKRKLSKRNYVDHSKVLKSDSDDGGSKVPEEEVTVPKPGPSTSIPQLEEIPVPVVPESDDISQRKRALTNAPVSETKRTRVDDLNSGEIHDEDALVVEKLVGATPHSLIFNEHTGPSNDTTDSTGESSSSSSSESSDSSSSEVPIDQSRRIRLKKPSNLRVTRTRARKESAKVPLPEMEEIPSESTTGSLPSNRSDLQHRTGPSKPVIVDRQDTCFIKVGLKNLRISNDEKREGAGFENPRLGGYPQREMTKGEKLHGADVRLIERYQVATSSGKKKNYTRVVVVSCIVSEFSSIIIDNVV